MRKTALLLAEVMLTQLEGSKLVAYQDQAGVWTIGYGTTGPNVCKGLVWTKQQAAEALRTRLGEVARAVDNAVHVPISDKQAAALYSLAYNAGISAFEHSHLLARINQRDPKAAEEMLDWCFITNPHTHEKEESEGLYKRRKQEYALFQADPFPLAA